MVAQYIPTLRDMPPGINVGGDPNSMKEQQSYADLLSKESVKPVHHPWEGVARIVEALMGGLTARKTYGQERNFYNTMQGVAPVTPQSTLYPSGSGANVDPVTTTGTASVPGATVPNMSTADYWGAFDR